MEEKCIFMNFYPSEYIYMENALPSVMGEGLSSQLMQDEEYLDKAVRFAKAKRINLCIFEREDSFRLDFRFHSVLIEKEWVLAFADIIFESDKFALKAEDTAPLKFLASFIRIKRQYTEEVDEDLDFF